MAKKTITALFDTYQAAADAVTRLEAAGIPESDISIVSNDPTHRDSYGDTGEHTGTATGASLGTVLGGGAGLLAGLGMLAIPGLGPVVAAGWLASTLVGAGVGAAAGGVVGSLTDAGVSREDAHAYAEGISRGGTLVTVRADESLQGRVADILDVEGTVDLNERVSDWQSTGWTGGYDGTRDTGSTVRGTEAGIGAAASRAKETIRDDARKIGNAVTGAPDTRETTYPAGTRLSDAERSGRARVRVYDTTI
jgi:hypothetical protein